MFREFIPVNDRVLCRRLETEESKYKNLILPEKAEEVPLTVQIIKCGPGRLLKDGSRAAINVKPGDIAIISKFSGRDVEIAGEKLVVIRDTDVLLLLEENNAKTQEGFGVERYDDAGAVH